MLHCKIISFMTARLSAHFSGRRSYTNLHSFTLFYTLLYHLALLHSRAVFRAGSDKISCSLTKVLEGWAALEARGRWEQPAHPCR